MIGTTRNGLPTHERLPDLLAASDDPHPRKTRRIEFVGERSPFDDERVQANMLLGRYTPTMMEAIRVASKKAVVRIDKFMERVFECYDHRSLAPVAHLKRTYRWHAGNNYIENVDFADVDVILGSPSGHQFVDLDAPGYVPKPVVFTAEVFKLIATEFLVKGGPEVPTPGHGSQGQGSRRSTTVLAAH